MGADFITVVKKSRTLAKVSFLGFGISGSLIDKLSMFIVTDCGTVILACSVVREALSSAIFNFR